MSQTTIYQDILKQHAILEASAGTGKTYSIVQMVITLLENQLKNENQPLSKILLMTFTNKAVAEIKHRLYKEFCELYITTTELEQKEIYLSWLQNFSQIEVYSIHSFLHRCIPLLDTAKQYQEISQQNSNNTVSFLDKARDIFLDLLNHKVHLGYFDGLVPEDIDFLIALSDLEKKEWDRVFHKSFKDKSILNLRQSLIRVLENYESFISIDNQSISTKPEFILYNKEQLMDVYQKISELLNPKVIDSILESSKLITGTIEQNISALLLQLEKLKKCDNIYEKISLLVLCRIEKIKITIEKSKKNKYSSLQMEEIYEVWEIIQTLQYQVFLYLTLTVGQDISENPLNYSYKGKLQLANKLAANYYHKPYKQNLFPYQFVFIDEFQDTSTIEWETLKMILWGIEKDPHIYIIGDPKQAIYQFKGSDIHAYYQAKKDLIAKGGKEFYLHTNYRTEKTLLQKMNQFFSSFGLSSNYQPIVASKELIANTNPLAVISIDTKTSIITEKDFIQGIEQIIISIKQEQMEFPNRNIVILAEKNKQLLACKNQLEKYKIPYLYYAQKGLFQTLEAQNIRAFFYMFLPFQTQSLDILLGMSGIFFFMDASPLYDFSNITDTQKQDFEIQYKQYFSIIQKCQWAVLKNLLLSMQAPLWVNKISERSWKIYEQILTQIFQVSYTNHYQIQDIIEYLEQMIADDENKNEANQFAISSHFQSVQLMTIHAAKGLQFDTVYIIPNYKPKTPKYPCIVKETQKNQYTSVLLMHNTQENAVNILLQNEQDQKNLIYVAITRAVYQVYICYPYKSQYFLAQNIKQALNQGYIKEYIPSNTSIETSIKQESHHYQEYQIPFYRHRSWQMLSYTSLAKKYKLPWVKEESFQEAVLEQPIFLPSGKHTGIFLHTILENIPWIWTQYSNNFRLYVQKMMGKYSFLDIPEKVLEKILLYGRLSLSVEEKIKDSTLNQFIEQYLMYDPHLQLSIYKEGGVFENQFVFLIQKILELKLPKQKQTLQEIILSSAEQEITVSFQPSKKLVHQYIESTLDMVFIGTDNKIYFLDWKTDTLPSYKTEYLQEHTHKEYLLQWHIYWLALLGFCKTFLADFSYKDHMGGFYYLYVRGIHNKETQGVYFHKAPDESKIAIMQNKIDTLISNIEIHEGL